MQTNNEARRVEGLYAEKKGKVRSQIKQTKMLNTFGWMLYNQKIKLISGVAYSPPTAKLALFLVINRKFLYSNISIVGSIITCITERNYLVVDLKAERFMKMVHDYFV